MYTRLVTLEAASRHRYGRWRFDPHGEPYAPDHCAMEVPAGERLLQCSRKNGHGPNGLFCRQHASLTVSVSV
jgi:hypothetical protein